MDKARGHPKYDQAVDCDARFGLRYRLSLRLPPLTANWHIRARMLYTGQLSPRRELGLFFVSLAFRPFSLFYIVDSSCIYTSHLTAVLAVVYFGTNQAL